MVVVVVVVIVEEEVVVAVLVVVVHGGGAWRGLWSGRGNTERPLLLCACISNLMIEWCCNVMVSVGLSAHESHLGDSGSARHGP